MTLLLWLRPSGTEYRNNGTCRQPLAMDGGFTFTSCGCSCCDRDRSQPAQSRWSCRTMKSFQSLTRHHPLRFCRASEVKSQAPSYSFLLLGALKGVFKGSSRIITYTDRCVNFQFESYNWNVLSCVDISNAHRKRNRSAWTKSYKCNRGKARICKLGRPLMGAAKSLTHHPRHMTRTQSF